MRLSVVVLLAVAAVAAAGASATAGAAPRRAVEVEIRFTGQGGGRYLDVTRWLRDDTRDCYARRTADERVSVSWKLAWRARLVPTATGYALRDAKPLRPVVAGSVNGKTVRDACDIVDADLDPSWVGSDRCLGPLPVRSDGGLAVGAASRLRLRGPVFGSAPKPCELTVRNDQLAAHVRLAPAQLARLAAGRALALPVGTNHPRPGDTFLARHFCSAFPHVYDGVVYLYDCDDTLVWTGTLSLGRA